MATTGSGGLGSLSSRANPRRRPRNASDDSIAVRQPVKRRKRSGLTKETFQAPEDNDVQSDAIQIKDESQANGVAISGSAVSSTHMEDTNFAMRHRGIKRTDSKRRGNRSDNDLELTRNDNYIVTQVPTMPELLTNSLDSDPWRTEFSPPLGLAIATTHTQAVIWRYKQAKIQTEPFQTLRVPLLYPTTNARNALPLGMLVATSSEPAILIIMPNTGRIIYWDSLSAAASVDANRRKQQSIQGTIVGMTSGEIAKAVAEAEPRGFVITMSSGRLVHLSVTDSQGNLTVVTETLGSSNNPRGSLFGSIRGVFTASGWRQDVVATRPWKSSQRGQRYMVTVTSKGCFQLWDLNWSGQYTLLREIDAKTYLSKTLVDALGRREQSFEILDMVLPAGQRETGGAGSKLVDEDCHLIILTAFETPQRTTYSIASITMSTDSVTVHVVHPLTFYQEPIANKSSPKARLMVADALKIAVIAFEQSIVLVSLGEAEENPDSQLQVESHTLPDPFQDVLTFRHDKFYSTVGAVEEPMNEKADTASCVIAVHGYGLIRVTILPVEQSQALMSRSTVTAQTKIEQAVFYGNLPQALFDFAPRAEVQFHPKEVELAALNISHSIASSTSKYLPSLFPSMEQQLTRRSLALSELNGYLRTHYPLLPANARWKLLWNAEKMASAQNLWALYDEGLSESDEGSKELWNNIIDGISQKLKKENRPEYAETDAVRHWFIHDVWRLEYLIAYVYEVLSYLAQHSSTAGRDDETLPRAQDSANAAQIQLSALESALRFREENCDAYGFDMEALSDGVLQSPRDFEGIDSFWTSSEIILPRVKELIDIVRETARDLAAIVAEDMEHENSHGEVNGGHKEDYLDDLLATMQELATYNPRQIDVCCQIYLERSRWLRSRPNADSQARGDALLEAYKFSRQTQIVALVELQKEQEAIQLAEKYWDMNALCDILEGQKPDTEIDGMSVRGRIHMYFKKYGMRWAEVYFARSLNRGGDAAVGVLNKRSTFRKYLLNFFRDHPEYANVGWVNEIAEGDYDRSAANLEIANLQNNDVWSQKVFASLEKLSMLTSISNSKLGLSKTDSALELLDQRNTLLSIQSSLFHNFAPDIKSAIDDVAALDLAMEQYGARSVQDRPSLHHRLRNDLERLFARESLLPMDLIDALTLLDSQPGQSGTISTVTSRFFLAFQTLKLLTDVSQSKQVFDLRSFSDRSTVSVPTSLFHAIAEIIWRRCFLASDWVSLNRTEFKSDLEVSQGTQETPLYETLLHGYRTLQSDSLGRSISENSHSTSNFWDSILLRSPADVLGDGGPHLSDADIESLYAFSIYPPLAPFQPHFIAPSDILHDLQTEKDNLAEQVEQGRLQEWFHGLVDAAKTAARNEDDLEGDEKARALEIEAAFLQKNASINKGSVSALATSTAANKRKTPKSPPKASNKSKKGSDAVLRNGYGNYMNGSVSENLAGGDSFDAIEYGGDGDYGVERVRDLILH